MIKTVISTYGEYIGDVDEGADVVVIKKPKMNLFNQNKVLVLQKVFV